MSTMGIREKNWKSAIWRTIIYQVGTGMTEAAQRLADQEKRI
jgi:hypothetical protein